MNDTVPVSPSFVLLAANPSNSDQLRHRLSLELDNPPHIVVLQGTPKVGSFKPLNKELPTTVDLMTLQARNSACSKVGFRVRHLHEVTEQNVHDEAVSLDTLFAPPLKLSSFQERTLSFNQPITNPSNSTVILKPLHVKSFLLQF